MVCSVFVIGWRHASPIGRASTPGIAESLCVTLTCLLSVMVGVRIMTCDWRAVEWGALFGACRAHHRWWPVLYSGA